MQSIRCKTVVTLPLTLRVHRGAALVLTFCFFLFNDKKKARPAGQNPSASAEIKSVVTPNRKGQGPGRAGARPLQGGKRNTPSREKAKRWRNAQCNTPYHSQSQSKQTPNNNTAWRRTRCSHRSTHRATCCSVVLSVSTSITRLHVSQIK